MELKLPQNQERLTLTEVLAVIDRYRRNNPAVIDLYDLTNHGPHDEILAIDLLSLNALNAFGNGAMSAMTSMWERRSDVEGSFFLWGRDASL
jgi:hypothetical protein